MDSKFIYVFSTNDRDMMIDAGFKLLYSSPEGNCYQFLADDRLTFALDNVRYVLTNRMTF